MAKHVINKSQFQETGAFEGDPRSIPPEFGSQPVPAGHVRFHHYTSSPESARSIKQSGLLRSYGEESFARGGTESPEVFATAGHPSEDFKRQNVFVEGYANANTFRQGGQLGIGSYGGERGGIEEHVKRMEKGRSTITALGDIPSHQILAAHEPWHEHARYMAREGVGSRVDPKNPYATGSIRSQVARGEHESLLHDQQFSKTYGPAIKSVKITNAATVMLGGKL
jgi:hypothetical protein